MTLTLCQDSLQNSISGGFCFRDARVVKDMATGKSKGYGFVSFFNKWVSTIRSAVEWDRNTQVVLIFLSTVYLVH